MLPWRCPVSRGGVSPSQALAWNRRTCRLDTDGRADHRADPGRRADPAGDGPHTTRHPEPVRHPTNDKSGRTPNPEDSNTWRSAPRSSRDLAQFVSLDAELGFICRPPGRARGAGRRVGRDSWMSRRMRALHRLPEPERRVDRAGDGARLAEAPDRQLGEGEPPTRSHRARPARWDEPPRPLLFICRRISAGRPLFAPRLRPGSTVPGAAQRTAPDLRWAAAHAAAGKRHRQPLDTFGELHVTGDERVGPEHRLARAGDAVVEQPPARAEQPEQPPGRTRAAGRPRRARPCRSS